MNTFCVGSLALYPQFCNSEHVLDLLNMNIFLDFGKCPFNRGRQLNRWPLNRGLTVINIDDVTWQWGDMNFIFDGH